MKKTLPFLLQILVFGCLYVNAEPQRPNVILFLVDDMGLMDTSVPMLAGQAGKPKRYLLNDWYRTPNMERFLIASAAGVDNNSKSFRSSSINNLSSVFLFKQ